MTVAKKTKYDSIYVSLGQAAEAFEQAAQLLDALKDGSIVAEGRYNADATYDDPHGSSLGGHQSISITDWHDCHMNLEEGALFHSQHHYAWEEIKIQKAQLRKLLKKQGADETRRGIAGRTPAYEWDRFWQAVVWDFAYGDPVPNSQRAWANRFLQDTEIWGNAKKPNVRTVTDKLAPIHKRYMQQEKHDT